MTIVAVNTVQIVNMSLEGFNRWKGQERNSKCQNVATFLTLNRAFPCIQLCLPLLKVRACIASTSCLGSTSKPLQLNALEVGHCKSELTSN